MSLSILVIPRQGLTASDAVVVSLHEPDVVIFRGKIGEYSQDTARILSRKNVYSIGNLAGVESLGTRTFDQWTLTDNLADGVDQPNTVLFAWERVKLSHALVIYNDFALYNLSAGLAPKIEYLSQQPEVILTIHSEPVYRGVVHSTTLAKYTGGNALEDYYAGQLSDIGIVVNPLLAKDRYAQDLISANKRIAQLVNVTATPAALLAAATRFSTARAGLKTLDTLIAKHQIRRGRTVAQITADIGNRQEPPKVDTPLTPRPTGNLADLRRELAEIDGQLSAPEPVLMPTSLLEKSIAEIENQLPSAAGLPPELAAEVAKYDKPALRAKLEDLRAKRAANEQIKKDMAARTFLEGRRASIQASIAAWNNAAVWAAYDARQQWETANKELAGLYAELEYAKKTEANEAELADLLARREHQLAETLLAAAAYGSAAGQSCVMDVDDLRQQLAAALAYQTEIQEKIKSQQAERATAMQQINTRAAQLLQGLPKNVDTTRAANCIALAEIIQPGRSVFIKSMLPDQLMRKLIDTFPVVIMPKDNDYVTQKIEIKLPQKTLCTCGKEVKTSSLQRHLGSKVHRH